MDKIIKPNTEQIDARQAIEIFVRGNIASLSDSDKLRYYNLMCSTLKLNPATRPFEFISLNGKLQLYAKKDATDQLRATYAVSLEKTGSEVIDGIYIVTVKATINDRTDFATGAVPIENLKGDAKANAIMKAETKAKRRATLSICGLGILDETEIETITDYKVVDMPATDAQLSEFTELISHAVFDGLPQKNKKFATRRDEVIAGFETIKSSQAKVDSALKILRNEVDSYRPKLVSKNIEDAVDITTGEVLTSNLDF